MRRTGKDGDSAHVLVRGAQHVSVEESNAAPITVIETWNPEAKQ